MDLCRPEGLIRFVVATMQGIACSSIVIQVIREGTGQAFLRLKLRNQELLSQDPMLPGLRPVRAPLVSYPCTPSAALPCVLQSTQAAALHAAQRACMSVRLLHWLQVQQGWRGDGAQRACGDLTHLFFNHQCVSCCRACKARMPALAPAHTVLCQTHSTYACRRMTISSQGVTRSGRWHLSDSPRMAAGHAKVWRAGVGSSTAAGACSRLWNRARPQLLRNPIFPSRDFSGGFALQA
jgi:hypothetical protein